ncbi:hypothetical protein AB0F13_18500 [Streptomyces sp. NPDC026206]|uniref:hypothetical protein n=1 Tax=Streptomyces sp. NPDC026206 TaxID=3157089 RepID=UPI0034068DB3
MSRTPLFPPPPASAGPAPHGAQEHGWDDHVTVRRLLRALAIAACAPYLSLKVAWLAGSRIGIPQGSTLLDDDMILKAANAVTVLMDLGVIGLALLLTRPWGRRIPSWLLLLPMWGATGLLIPVMAGFPAQLLLRALGVTSAEKPSGAGPFLAEWVFQVVYGGFIVQGLALGALFTLYARRRWGHLWQGDTGEAAGALWGRGQQLAAGAAALLAVAQAGVHLMWASGSRDGLPPTLAGQYTADMAVQDAAYALYGALAVTGLVLLRRGGRALPLRGPLLLAGVGSSAVGCWGAWMLAASLLRLHDGDRAATGLMMITYSVQVIVGLLVLAAGARFFSRRAASEPAS